jgi:hypothetical protein
MSAPGSGSTGVKTSSRAALGRGRYWWQSHPMAGLTAGWVAIALVGLWVWSAFNVGHG